MPILDDNSQKFWKNIVKNELKTLEFEDKLKIHALSGHEIGDFEIKVNPVIFKRVDCFKVVARRYLRVEIYLILLKLMNY